MATLVQFLAAGVNGAASGTATFLLRGTASSAAAFLYNDFEQTAQPGTNVIALDANGAAEVYCSVYVDVTIRNSAGTLLRTVTVGNSDAVVEVRSDSFRGTDYDGSPANTIGEPITLRAVLDQWILSAGSADFQVDVGGVATNLSTALAGITGLFINVKDPQYGAVGDGVTDDTTAISAAIAAAAVSGGVVFFPPGTYLCAQIATSAPSFALLGFGQATLRGTAGTTLVIQDNTPAAFKLISGIKFEGNGGPIMALDIEGDNTVFIDNCTFDEAGFTQRLIRLRDDNGRYFISRCRFDLSASASSFSISHSDGDNKRVMISDCHFTIPASYTRSVIGGSCFNIDNCVFDASAVTSGTYHMIDPEHPTTVGAFAGNVSNCTFIDGGSSGYVFDLRQVGADCDFSEDGNTFIGFTAPSGSADLGHIYRFTAAAAFDTTSKLHLGSRRGRTVHFTNTASTFTVSACIEAEYVVIEQSTNGILCTIPALLPGLSGRVIVFVANGQPELGVNFADSAGFGTFLRLDSGSEQAMTPGAGGDECSSCGYATTIRANGTLRSIITAEVSHHN